MNKFLIMSLHQASLNCMYLEFKDFVRKKFSSYSVCFAWDVLLYYNLVALFVENYMRNRITPALKLKCVQGNSKFLM